MPDVSSAPLILQLCPNDHPPFRDICSTYQRAGESLGCRVRTIFFGKPQGEPLPDAFYLDVADSGNNRLLVSGLKSQCADLERMPLLVVCHRYRALRTFVASRLSAHRVVAVAHEFKMLARRRRRIARALFARRVTFAGVSPAVTQELSEHAPVTVCLPNAIDLPELDQMLYSRAAARRLLGLPDAAFAVAVVGRLIPWKRPQLAIEAIRVLKEGDQVQLQLLGDGPLHEDLQAQARGLNVHLPGFLPDARLLLPAFDALLIVSEAREAFGMVALEAMAAGVPVIAGSSPGPRFVLGEHAVYYRQPEPAAVAEALAEMRQRHQRGETRQLVAQARLRAQQQFSVTALAARLDALFFLQR